MGRLWDAITNTVRQKRDDAAAKLEDPVRDGKFAIEDAERQVAEYKKDVRKHIASIKTMEKEAAEAEENRKKYDRMAKKFAKAIKAHDAEEEEMSQADYDKANRNLEAAAAKVEEFETKVKTLRQSIETNEGHRKALQRELEKAQDRIARAKQNHSTLAARKKAADIKLKLNESKDKISGGLKGLGGLDRLEQATIEAESEAEASDELAGLDDADLEAEAAAIGASDRASKYLS